jgi:hypothetical protein
MARPLPTEHFQVFIRSGRSYRFPLSPLPRKHRWWGFVFAFFVVVAIAIVYSFWVRILSSEVAVYRLQYNQGIVVGVCCLRQ